jgi:hypothetical protein
MRRFLGATAVVVLSLLVLAPVSAAGNQGGGEHVEYGDVMAALQAAPAGWLTPPFAAPAEGWVGRVHASIGGEICTFCERDDFLVAVSLMTSFGEGEAYATVREARAGVEEWRQNMDFSLDGQPMGLVHTAITIHVEDGVRVAYATDGYIVRAGDLSVGEHIAYWHWDYPAWGGFPPGEEEAYVTIVIESHEEHDHNATGCVFPW